MKYQSITINSLLLLLLSRSFLSINMTHGTDDDTKIGLWTVWSIGAGAAVGGMFPLLSSNILL